LMAQLRRGLDEADLAGQGLEPHAHVTLRYGILSDADLEGLREFLRSLDPFEITLGAVSSFPPTKNSGNAAVIKVDVSSPVLEELNAAIPQHCDFKPANFDYHAHATVGFVKSEAVAKYVGDDRLAGHTMEVHAVTITVPGMPDEYVPLLGTPAPWHELEKF